MTPFAEEVLEQLPGMERFFRAAHMFDLNSETQSIHDRVVAFAKGGLNVVTADLNPGDGNYWFECSGFGDLRWRIGFACGVEGQELAARLIICNPEGTMMSDPGVVWLLFSKLSPMVRILDVDGEGTKLDPTYGIILLSCIVEAMGR